MGMKNTIGSVSHNWDYLLYIININDLMHRGEWEKNKPAEANDKSCLKQRTLTKKKQENYR